MDEPSYSASSLQHSQPIKIGSRNSELAFIQSESVRRALEQGQPCLHFSIVNVIVHGDADKSTPFLQFNKVGPSDVTQSLWVEEMEEKLVRGDLDLLVHSLKDLPTTLPPGCTLGAIISREDPRDALIMRPGSRAQSLDDLPNGAVVETSSTRRKALIQSLNPRLTVRECRGNVDTRLHKLDDLDGQYSCILLATAGLLRMGLKDRITKRLSPLQFPYNVGQGALGIEIRDNDHSMLNLVRGIENLHTRWRCLAERAMLRTLQGGCSSPVGVSCFCYRKYFASNGRLARMSPVLQLSGTALHPRGTPRLEDSHSMDIDCDLRAEALGEVVEEKLLAKGAAHILAKIRSAEPKTE